MKLIERNLRLNNDINFDIELVTYDNHIQKPSDKNAYKDISQYYFSNIARQTIKDPDHPNSKYLERISFRQENLISGSINLINYIITQHESGTPVDSIVFLDKSARLGAYFFRKMWRVLKKQLPNGIKMPKNKFINIGRLEDDKDQSKQAKSLASEIFSKQELGDNVLVVDEYIETGESIKKAIKFLEDNHQIKAKALKLYPMPPKWHLRDTVKGIKDVDLDYSFYGLRSLSKSNFNTITSFITSFKGSLKQLKNIINTMRNDKQADTNKVTQAFQEIERTTDTDEVIRFFKSSGGYLGLKETNKQNIQSNALYRTALSSLAKAYGKHLEANPAS